MSKLKVLSGVCCCAANKAGIVKVAEPPLHSSLIDVQDAVNVAHHLKLSRAKKVSVHMQHRLMHTARLKADIHGGINAHT